MAKKGVNLDGLLNPTARPVDTGIPQRGVAQHQLRPERRSDQMSIRMTPSTRDKIERLAAAEGLPIAEIIERAVNAYKRE